ncbi:MAG: helix-turn-helix transcriptional regulator [Anaerolineae bacterium]|nr:helix-turn-helix transcriptional regulator [Anaerolineae bacterium]
MNNDQTTRSHILRYIIAFKRDHDGLTPTGREIAGEVSIAESTVRYHLQRLQNDGAIRLSRRGITVVGGEWFPPDED